MKRRAIASITMEERHGADFLLLTVYAIAWAGDNPESGNSVNVTRIGERRIMSNITRLAAVVVTALLILGPLSSEHFAQETLAGAKSIRCTFSLIAAGSLRGEPPKAEVKPANLPLHFESINTDEGTAQLKSGFGQYDIIVRYAKGYLHFIQSFFDGPLYTTTVLEKKTSTGKFKAMHSRHEYTDVSLPGFTSNPEQYYGECEVVN